jgi:surface protein
MSMKGTRDMNTTGSISRWVVAARRITVVMALFAALGVGVFAVPQPAQAAAPVIATTSTITTGVVDPVVSITTPQVFANSLAGGDFNINVGSTGLTVGTVMRVSDTEATIAFTGTAQLGAVTIQAGTSAFVPADTTDSNTVTVTVRDLFTTTWTTTSDGESITLPLYNGGSYNFTVDWGDGQSGTVTTWDDPARTHAYATAGTHTVTISGTIVGWSFNNGGDRNKIVGISKWGHFNPGNGGGAFRGCENLDITATDAPDLTGVTNLKEMFNDARKLTTPNFSNWNTASVRNMEGMFRGATAFNGDVTTWDTANVTGMREMFANAKAFNQAIGVWNTANVTGMDGMFRGAEAFNQPLATNGSIWNTAKVTTMREMFSNARAFNQDLNTWVTSSVAGNGMEGMFRGATAFNGNVTTWDTAKVTTMREMFADAKAFNQAIGVWNTANVTNMEGMFRGATAFNGNVTTWDTAKVTTMREMFADAKAFNQDLNTWVTSSVAGNGMEGMFRGATAFNGNVTTWDTAKVTTMREMFADAKAFNQAIGVWNTANVTNMEGMFRSAEAFNQPLVTNGSIWNTAKVTTMREMFNNARAFNQDLNTWVTSSVAGNGMEGMFRGATAFNGNVTTWDTAKVTTMREMFKEAEAFNQPIGSWDTGSVLNMERMFNGAKAFNYPLETWTTTQVTNMHKMFEEATVFNQPLGLWNTSNVTDMEQMFWLARGYNQSLAGLEVTGLTRPLGLFMTLSGMTPLNVDATLTGWAAQALPTRSIALNLGNNGGSPGNLDNNFYTQGSGSVAVDALRAKGWTVSNGNFISTADSLPTPTTATMNAGDSRTFSVLLKASGSHSYTYDSRSVLSATPTLAGASASAVTYDSDGTYTFEYTAPSNVGGAAISAVSAASAFDDTITVTVNGQTIQTPIRVTINPVAPSAPTITSATPGNGSAAVAFTAPTSNGGSAITDYEYRLDGGAWVSVGSTSSPFTITGLTNGTSYQVELRAVNGVGPGPESVPVTVTPAVPATPRAPVSAPALVDRVARVFGSDRFATSVAVSLEFAVVGAPAVYVASGVSLADAMVAGSYAAEDGGSVLFVERDRVPAGVMGELRRLAPREVVVVGGHQVVAPSVEQSLVAAGFRVRRVAGADRYATAVALSKRGYASTVSTVYVASGVAFADAMPAGVLAAIDDGPVLLVTPGGVPAVTAAELVRLRPERIVIVGGPAEVGAAVEASLRSYAARVVRVSGVDRYETAVALSQSRFDPGVPAVFVMSGDRFPDALAAVAPAGRLGGPILLSSPTCVPASVRAEIGRLQPGRIIIIGGGAVLGSGIDALATC